MVKWCGQIWIDDRLLSRAELKSLTAIASVLGYSNFSELFTVETDASQTGIGAVLMQKEHPLAYCSSKLTGGGED